MQNILGIPTLVFKLNISFDFSDKQNSKQVKEISLCIICKNPALKYSPI